LVWTPWCRRRVLSGAVETRLREIVAGVVDVLGGRVVEVEVISDGVRLLCEVPPRVPPSNLMMFLKGRSSGLLAQGFPGWRGARMRCLWSPSWLVSTVGGALLEVVGGCVEVQKRVA